MERTFWHILFSFCPIARPKKKQGEKWAIFFVKNEAKKGDENWSEKTQKNGPENGAKFEAKMGVKNGRIFDRNLG